IEVDRAADEKGPEHVRFEAGETDGGEGSGEPEDRPNDRTEGGQRAAADRLRSPSSLHAFNRYELKYLVPSDQIGDIRADLDEGGERAPSAGPRGYGVCSVYYDTSPPRLYLDKVEGLNSRRNLRIRRYGETGEAADENSPVSVE